jgi:3-oxoacyl-[acyl-carrier protein] reductase
MNDLNDRVAVVTGGSGGIGSEICRQLAAAGASVVLTYNRDAEGAQRVADGLPGDDHLVVQTRVDDSASVAQLAQQVAERYGTLDLLVNNAGMTRFVPHDDLDALDDDLIDQIFRVNWRGAFACVRAFKSLLMEGDGGVVINITSIAGRTGNGSNVAYCASKAALDCMTLSLARVLAPWIRVVSVSPGLVDGEYARSFDPTWRAEQIEKTPTGRLATPDDVARAVLAVATALPQTTGVILPVDGGRPLR